MGTEIISFLPSYLICIDNYNEYDIEGRLYWNRNMNGNIKFTDISQLLMKLEDIMENIQCPCAANEMRYFVENKDNKNKTISGVTRKETIKSMRDLDTHEERGKKATFVLQIKFRQNSSWQGTVKWIEKKQEINFRSALELIKIIDSACEQGYQAELVAQQA